MSTMKPFPSSDPSIDPKISDLIQDKLEDIELEHDIEILYACESGSRAWGFASEDSDYDVRFIYRRTLKDYLKVFPKKDTIEVPISYELDINGWDIKKALGLAYNSNPALLEWFESPIVYRIEKEIVGHLHNLARRYFDANAGVQHHQGLVKKVFHQHLLKEEVTAKKYLYAIRSILSARYIRLFHSEPPIVLNELSRYNVTIESEDPVREAIHKLLEDKITTKESKPIPRNEILHNFIEHEMKEVFPLPVNSPFSRNVDEGAINEFFFQAVK